MKVGGRYFLRTPLDPSGRRMLMQRSFSTRAESSSGRTLAQPRLQYVLRLTAAQTMAHSSNTGNTNQTPVQVFPLEKLNYSVIHQFRFFRQTELRSRDERTRRVAWFGNPKNAILFKRPGIVVLCRRTPVQASKNNWQRPLKSYNA